MGKSLLPFASPSTSSVFEVTRPGASQELRDLTVQLYERRQDDLQRALEAWEQLLLSGGRRATTNALRLLETMQSVHDVSPEKRATVEDLNRRRQDLQSARAELLIGRRFWRRRFVERQLRRHHAAESGA